MLPLIFAQASDLPPPNSAAAIGWIVLTIGGACLALNQIASFYFTLKPRKTPPDHELYATKAELHAVRLKIEEDAEKSKQEHKESDERIEKRFESWMEQQQSQHEDSMRKFDEAIDRFSEWQLAIERALGVVATKADFALDKGKR